MLFVFFFFLISFFFFSFFLPFYAGILPGRLIDHLENQQANVAQKLLGLSVLVLDEADRLLDMGYCYASSCVFSFFFFLFFYSFFFVELIVSVPHRHLSFKLFLWVFVSFVSLSPPPPPSLSGSVRH
jgi:hypothetical protein